MPFNHLWPLQRVCLEGVKSSPSQEACFCSLDCGEIKSFGQAENSALSSFPSNFQISMERMRMFFFLQSSNAILCHCGDYSWIAVRDYSTWRFGRRSSPHRRRAMTFDSTAATRSLTPGWWQRSSDSPTVWLWRAEHQPTVLSMRSLFPFSIPLAQIVLTQNCIHAKSCWHPLPTY